MPNIYKKEKRTTLFLKNSKKSYIFKNFVSESGFRLMLRRVNLHVLNVSLFPMKTDTSFFPMQKRQMALF